MYLTAFLGNQIACYIKYPAIFNYKSYFSLLTSPVSSVIINNPTGNWLRFFSGTYFLSMTWVENVYSTSVTTYSGKFQFA